MAYQKHKNMPQFPGFTKTCLHWQIHEGFALDPALFGSITCQKVMFPACGRFMSQAEHPVSLM